MDLRSQLTILFCKSCRRFLAPGALYSDNFRDTEELCHRCQARVPRLALELNQEKE